MSSFRKGLGHFSYCHSVVPLSLSVLSLILLLQEQMSAPCFTRSNHRRTPEFLVLKCAELSDTLTTQDIPRVMFDGQISSEDTLADDIG